MHALLGIDTADDLAGHPVLGASWEGVVVESLLACAPPRTAAAFYRTAVGAIIDLVLDIPNVGRWVVETKYGAVQRPAKGFYFACEDLAPSKCFMVRARGERYPISRDLEALSVHDLASLLLAL